LERFTERARQVVVLALEEARGLGHEAIGTEHLLLGLLREEEGVAAQVLAQLGVVIEDVRRRLPHHESGSTGQLPFAPAANEALELALRDALSLGHNYIGTEHVLLGILRVREAPAAAILSQLGIEPEAARQQVLDLIGGEHPRRPPTLGSHRRRGWQYHVVPLEGPITEKLLAPLGRDGWELVTVVGERAVFKRPA
jgi:ATP-dependent Clp protease ATP-binding subunit ClpC